LAIVFAGLGLALGGAGLNSALPPAPSAAIPAATPGEAVWRQAGGAQRFWAGWCWLEGNLAWERRKEAELRRWLRRVTEAEPREFHYWANGARMLAFDLPAWRSEREPAAPAAVRAHWRREAAAEALAWLERAEAWHGRTAALGLERGRICLYGLEDRAAAARYFRQAAGCRDAPPYVARLAAELERGGP